MSSFQQNIIAEKFYNSKVIKKMFARLFVTLCALVGKIQMLQNSAE